MPGQAEQGEAVHPAGTRTAPRDAQPSSGTAARLGPGTQAEGRKPQQQHRHQQCLPQLRSHACAWRQGQDGDRDRDGSRAASQLSTLGPEPAPPAEHPGEEGGGFLADNQLSRKRGGRGKPVPGTLQASPGEEVGEPGEGEQVPVTRLKEAPAPQQEVLDARAMTGRGLRPSTSHPAPAPAH